MPDSTLDGQQEGRASRHAQQIADAEARSMLDDKVVVVTGAASGMGRSTALLCARLGASVAATDLNAPGVEEVVMEIRRQGGNALSYAADLTREAEVASLVKTVVSTFGTVHVLHNNAYAVHPDAAKALADTSLEAWDWTIRTCLTSQFLCARAVLPQMMANGSGSIINVASGAGVAGAPTSAAYGIAKAGTFALTKYIATQYGKHGIRCNTIVPGRTLGTGWTDHIAPDSDRARRVVDEMLSEVCMPDLAGSDDIAPVVAFLASDEARYVQAATIDVTGGMFAHLPGATGAPTAPDRVEQGSSAPGSDRRLDRTPHN